MKLTTPPFDDIRVRRALAMAINNREIADTYYGGNAEVLSYPVPPIKEYEASYTPLEELPESTRELYGYHPDKAKELLAEAGYPDGFKTEIVTTETYVDLLSIVQAYWADIGVDLEINVKERAVFIAQALRKTYEQILAMNVAGAVPFKFVYARPESLYNFGLVDDPRMNEAMTEITAAYFDESKKHLLMKELIQYELDQSYQIALPGPNVYTLWQPWVKGYNGEWAVGYKYFTGFPMHIWYDQDLKEEMTGER